MNRTALPTAFQERMRDLLGEEAAAFFASYDAPRSNGLRVNTRRISAEDFVRMAPFALERVPWAENGFYTDHRDRAGQHPLYRAGLYYLQEPSAMAPAALLAPQPGERVLDLCAAPGGKATELGARLRGEGLLVANEISASRAKALLRNIEAFGIPNAVVTNTGADRLAERYAGSFDRVLVDAPCSGEGMFRKDADTAAAWTPDKPARCAAVQRDLVLRAADLLRPGGTLVYSTCTFAPEEDEWVLVHLLRERPDMELVPIPLTGGREDFARAFSTQELCRRGFPERGAGTDGAFPTEYAVRIWPHRARGEGHFIALLRKRGSAGIPSAQGSTRKDGMARGVQKKSKGRGREVVPSAGLTRQQRAWVEPFLSLLAPDRPVDPARLEVHAGQVFLNPEGVPDLRGLSFLRSGLRLGELKKDRFEPGQELAMAAGAEAEGDASVRRISFAPQDPALLAYLRGETVRTQLSGQGWSLVCAGIYPVGWGKLAGGLLKNKYPAAWRVDLRGPVC